MAFQKIKSLAAVSMVFCGFLGLSEASQGLRLIYAPDIPSWQRDLMESDGAFISSLKWSDSDGEFARIFGLNKVDGKSIDGWIQERARYIVGSSVGMTRDDLVDLGKKVQIDQPPDLPRSQGQRMSMLEVSQTAVSATAPAGVMMTNLTSTAYTYSKAHKRLVAMPIDGIGVLPVTTQRQGVFRIGDAYFRTHKLDNSADPSVSLASRIRRIKSLAHEGRHGDGNQDNATFPHDTCPADSDFAGLPACDSAANGPYRIGSLISRSALEACQKDSSCPVNQSEVLKLMMANDLSRILSPLKPTEIDGRRVRPIELDPRPETLKILE